MATPKYESYGTTDKVANLLNALSSKSDADAQVYPSSQHSDSYKMGYDSALDDVALGSFIPKNERPKK